MSFIQELKRRNVIKVAAAYIIVGWLIMQAGDTLAPALHLPDWVNSLLAFFLLLGFPVAMVLAWAFEITPDGIKKEKDVDRSQSITPKTGQKLNNVILALMTLAIGYLLFDKFSGQAQTGSESKGSGSISDTNTVTTDKSTSQKMNLTPLIPSQQSIAVLPFVNMSSDKEQEYFSDGLSEELLNLLAKIPELRVAARTSSFSFKGQNIEIPEIAKRLKVAHVLEGSVRKSGNQIRITAQLIKAENGYHLWSESYDRELVNIFQIQDEIAVAVVDALKITLLGEAPQAKETDPRAYQLFLEGQFHRRQITVDSLAKAITLFKKALEIDPDYSPAWAELAYSYIWYVGIGAEMSIKEGNEHADRAIEKALSTDPDYAFAYFVRGASRVVNKFEFKTGIQDYQHALQLDPGNAFLMATTGTSARIMGRIDEAIALYLTALERDPVMPEVLNSLSMAYLYANQWDEAEAAYRNTLAISPMLAGAHFRLGRVLLRKGRPQDALTEMNKETSSVYRSTGLAMAHHALGNNKASDTALQELIKKNANGAAYQISEVYGIRGEADKAFEWLEQSYVIRDSGLASTLGNPAFRNLSSDPRWQPFLEKLGLLEFWLAMPPQWGGPMQ